MGSLGDANWMALLIKRPDPTSRIGSPDKDAESESRNAEPGRNDTTFPEIVMARVDSAADVLTIFGSRAQNRRFAADAGTRLSKQSLQFMSELPTTRSG